MPSCRVSMGIEAGSRPVAIFFKWVGTSAFAVARAAAHGELTKGAVKVRRALKWSAEPLDWQQWQPHHSRSDQRLGGAVLLLSY